MHPVDVALERVDLAVVGDVAIGMGPLPARKFVGRKALVDEAQGAGYIRIGKFFVEVGDLRGEQQTFVNNGATREGRNVKDAGVFDAGDGDLAFGALAHEVKFALEGVFGRYRGTGYGPAADENLLNVGLRTARDAANGSRKTRRIPPA